jgi:8-oxo-dGTP diphosphatase
MKRYVLGFVFDFGWYNILLILKAKPEWQLGKLNGLGGKIEEGETPAQAMEREFREETAGYDIVPKFIPFGRLHGGSWEVYLFHAKVMLEFPPDLNGIDVGEGITTIVPVEDLNHWETLPNLRYLIPMAKNHARGMDAAKFFDIAETEAP